MKVCFKHNKIKMHKNTISKKQKKIYYKNFQKQNTVYTYQKNLIKACEGSIEKALMINEKKNNMKNIRSIW